MFRKLLIVNPPQYSEETEAPQLHYLDSSLDDVFSTFVSDNRHSTNSVDEHVRGFVMYLVSAKLRSIATVGNPDRKDEHWSPAAIPAWRNWTFRRTIRSLWWSPSSNFPNTSPDMCQSTHNTLVLMGGGLVNCHGRELNSTVQKFNPWVLFQ